jgi:hypothetical protein
MTNAGIVLMACLFIDNRHGCVPDGEHSCAVAMSRAMEKISRGKADRVCFLNGTYLIGTKPVPPIALLGHARVWGVAPLLGEK